MLFLSTKNFKNQFLMYAILGALVFTETLGLRRSFDINTLRKIQQLYNPITAVGVQAPDSFQSQRLYQCNRVVNFANYQGDPSGFGVMEYGDYLTKLFDKSGFQEFASGSENNPSANTVSNSTNYHVLVAVGATLEPELSFSLEKRVPNDFEELTNQLSTLANANLNVNQVIVHNDEIFQRGQELVSLLNTKLKTGMIKRKFVELTFTDYTVAQRTENLSGITATAENGRNVRMNRHRFSELFQLSQISEHYLISQFAVDAFHDLSTLSQQALAVNTQNTEAMATKRNEIETLAEKFQKIKNGHGTNKKTGLVLSQKITPRRGQLYLKPVTRFHLNPSVGLDPDGLSVGLGKATFRSLSSNYENIGLITGADVGFRVRSKTFRSGCFQAQGFVGVGVKF